eukprot:scaffold212862_cov20-Tisochrysis_lutea.AAC.3
MSQQMVYMQAQLHRGFACTQGCGSFGVGQLLIIACARTWVCRWFGCAHTAIQGLRMHKCAEVVGWASCSLPARAHEFAEGPDEYNCVQVRGEPACAHK